MGASVLWRVKVMRLIEDEVEIYAVTEAEAVEEAERMPGVFGVVPISPPTPDTGKEE